MRRESRLIVTYGRAANETAVREGVDMKQDDHARGPGFLTSRAGIVLVAFLIMVGFLLTSEHRAHALGALLWIAVLACPLMHLFMHGGHAGHGGEDRKEPKGTKEMAHEH